MGNAEGLKIRDVLLLPLLGHGVSPVEVADVDEEVEEFHYVNAATAARASHRRICILEGWKAGRPPFNSRPTEAEVNLGKVDFPREPPRSFVRRFMGKATLSLILGRHAGSKGKGREPQDAPRARRE